MKKTKSGFILVALSSLLFPVLLIGCGNFGTARTGEAFRSGGSRGSGTTSPPRTLQPLKSVTIKIEPSSSSSALPKYGEKNPVVIEPGTAVTWVNGDRAEHSATSDRGAFDSGALAPGASYSFVFSKPGTYLYHSTTDGDRMSGRVEVTRDPDPTTSVTPGDPGAPAPIPTTPTQCKQCQQQQKPVPKPEPKPTKPAPKPTKPAPQPTLD